MPCHSDPTRDERESVEIAQLLIYALGYLGRQIPKWLVKASTGYGIPQRSVIDKMTASLCAICRNELPDEAIWNGRNRQARRLADWWEDHMEWDRLRESVNKERLEKERLKKQAQKKLTREERTALGL